MLPPAAIGLIQLWGGRRTGGQKKRPGGKGEGGKIAELRGVIRRCNYCPPRQAKLDGTPEKKKNIQTLRREKKSWRGRGGLPRRRVDQETKRNVTEMGGAKLQVMVGR